MPHCTTPQRGCQRRIWPTCQTNLFSLTVAGGKNKYPFSILFSFPSWCSYRQVFQDAALFDCDSSLRLFKPLLFVVWLAGPIVQVQLVVSGPKCDKYMKIIENVCCPLCLLPCPISIRSVVSPEDMNCIELSYCYLLLVIVAAVIGVTIVVLDRLLSSRCWLW